MKRLLAAVAMLAFLSSCKVYFPDRLFKADEEQLAKADTLKTPKEYVIKSGDELSLGVFSNNGYELVDVLSKEGVAYSVLRYTVKENGFIRIPLLDSVSVIGLTIGEAEKLLANKYSYYFVNPFVRVDVTNRFVYVFRGRVDARIVTLTRENMNLIEILALAGGMPTAGKAFRVRVLRGNPNNPTVFDIDLSTVEGMKQANLTMIANDIVYIETRITSADVIYQITPVLTFLSTILLLYTTIYTISK